MSLEKEIIPLTTVGELLRDGVARLREAGIENADWEGRELMGAALRLAPTLVPLRVREAAPLAERERWDSLLSGRCSRRPLAQVLGEWDFEGVRLVVTPDVLVPRPETEEFVAWSAARMPPRVFSVADVGTGSGCIAVSLAKRFPGAFVWAVDLSSSALAVARRNAEAQGVAKRVFFMEGDLMTRFSSGLSLDAVVANLPYVDEKEMAGLPPEVRYEPEMALNGGPGGMALIRRMAVQAWERLQPGSRIFLEIGHDQAERVAELLRGMGYGSVETGRDFAGIERFVMGVR